METKQKPKDKLKATLISAGEDAESPTLFRSDVRVGRNEPCPCGSGKKAKNCCGIKPVLSYHLYRPRVTPEYKMKDFRKRIPFEIGETVLASKAFPVEVFRGKELIITERGMEERFGNFYFKVEPVDDPDNLVDTSIWYSDGHLVKPEHYKE